MNAKKLTLIKILFLVFISPKQASNVKKPVLATPWRWVSNEIKNWYFEKQTDLYNSITWIEYARNSIWAYYTQVSVGTDSCGQVVILNPRFDSPPIKLTEGMTCHLIPNLTCLEAKLTTGYWTKKNDDLALPWKWVADQSKAWYFEKQTKGWVEYSQNRILANYSEVIVDKDFSNKPAVVLKKQSVDDNQKDLIFLLLQEKACRFDFDANACFDSQTYPGYWIKKYDACNDLPSGCKYIGYRKKTTEQTGEADKYGLLCVHDQFNDEQTRALAKMLHDCDSIKGTNLQITIKSSSLSTSSSQKIIDKSFGIFKLAHYLPALRLGKIMLQFLSMKGFDIESSIEANHFTVILFYKNFNLYKQNRLITNGCGDFPQNSSTVSFIFGKTNQNPQFEGQFLGNFMIANPKAAYPICSLFFRHARLQQFTLLAMASSFLIKNMISFVGSSSTSLDNTDKLNSTIYNFYIHNSYGLDINERLVNPHIFARTIYFGFHYHINSIAANVFARLPNLSDVCFHSRYLLQVIRRQGIEWIKNMNAAVRVDIGNDTDIEINFHRFVFVCLDFDREFVLAKSSPSKRHFVTDPDFCLFAEFPFHQAVVFAENNQLTQQRAALTCTELWLYRIYATGFFLKRDFLLSKLVNRSNLTACQFERRLSLCRKADFSNQNNNISNHTSSVLSDKRLSKFDFMLVFELVLMLLGPLLATYALVANLLTIKIILDEANKKTMREKHYIYMSLHCGSNALVCLTQIVSLVSECQYPFGLVCSPVRGLVLVQYVKIVLGEYVNSVCRLLANFTYLAFALCRMVKVGKDHSKLVAFANDLDIRVYMCVCGLVSAGLCVSKAIQFDINLDMPAYAYPISLVQNGNRYWIFNGGYVAIVVVNSFVDVVNYVVFVALNFAVDVVLMVKLRRVLREKQAKLAEMKAKASNSSQVKSTNVKAAVATVAAAGDAEEASSALNESRRRVVYMVVFSSVLSLVTKVPSAVTSLNDVRLIIFNPVVNKNMENWFEFNSFSTNLSFRFFCMSEKSCVIFQQFGNCLFLVSLCSTLHFLKFFDRNFRMAYERTLKRESAKTGKTDNTDAKNNAKT